MYYISISISKLVVECETASAGWPDCSFIYHYLFHSYGYAVIILLGTGKWWDSYRSLCMIWPGHLLLYRQVLLIAIRRIHAWMNRESLSINVFVYITQLGVIYNGARVVVTHLGGFAKEGSFSADFAKQRSCLLHAVMYNVNVCYSASLIFILIVSRKTMCKFCILKVTWMSFKTCMTAAVGSPGLQQHPL